MRLVCQLALNKDPAVRVFACQSDIVWENKAATHAHVRDLIAAANPPAGSLLVLPEMFSTGFSMRVGDIAEAADGPSHTFLADLAAQYRSHVLAGLVTMQTDGRGRNEAVVFDPQGQLAARYCKRHPFSLGGEPSHYVAGDEVTLLPIGPLMTAPTICYDLRFPETYRRATQRGAQLIVAIANWPAARISHWRSLLIARAIENQAYVVGVNRAGAIPISHTRAKA